MSGKLSFSIQIGAGFDTSSELLWSLRRDSRTLMPQHILAPRPKSYRDRLALRARELQGAALTTDELCELIALQPKDLETAHIVLRDTLMMDDPAGLYDGDRWFPNLGQEVSWMRSLFAPAEVDLLITMRNPALILSDARATDPQGAMAQQMPNPFDLSWAAILSDLRRHCPKARITTWRAEEQPFIWHKIIMAATGLTSASALTTTLEPLDALLEDEGMDRLRSYLNSHPNLSDDLRTKVLAIFINRYGRSEAFEDELNIPGWSPELQEEMERQYATDVEAVAAMDGITLLEA